MGRMQYAPTVLPEKRVDFLRSHVGAYCIRPTERHPKDGECVKHDTFLGYSFHRWNVCGAYAIRPYRVTRKRVNFLRSHVGAYCIRPTKRHPKDGECAKRDTFLGYSFHRWNVFGAYAIRPYRVTGKRVDFLRSHVGAYCIRPTGRHPKDGECAKRVTFSISIMYPTIFPGLGRGLDFLLPSFLVSRQEKRVEAR